jgi:ABC-type lipoprotein release transport system permease subunit
MLFDLQPYDPLTFAASSALLLALACVSCWLPARRSLRADPLQALRNN